MVALLFVCCARVFAHGDFHPLIKLVNEELEKNPNSAELYFKRGELYRAHQDWDSALADYDQAALLDPRLAAIDLARGKLLLDANWPRSAKRALDRFLARHPNQSEALACRARAHLKLEQRVEAAQDFDRAVAHAEGQPELYIERAQAIAALGEEQIAEALRGLDEGLKKLGPLVTLQLCAIDLELKRKDYDNALARLDRAAAQSPRKETWLARRGEILTQAGRAEEAHEAFRAALKALDTLPPARRNVPAMLELEKRLRAALEEAQPTEAQSSKLKAQGKP
jgi:tetratricopeptide (TPR) repeat protein